jgi:Pyruvate/2-oxoacid:ferredoxin oxidoreductase delta subunit
MSGAIDRRAFLVSAPRRLFSGVKALLHEVAAFPWPAAGGQEPAARRQVAVLDVSRCLAWSETDCQICYLKCPKRDQAIMLEGSKPTIVTSVCDGCGICVDVCRSVNDCGAIEVLPRLAMGEATRWP